MHDARYRIFEFGIWNADCGIRFFESVLGRVKLGTALPVLNEYFNG